MYFAESFNKFLKSRISKNQNLIENKVKKSTILYIH